MACVYQGFIDELIHCSAVFSENLPCTFLHLQRAGNGRIIMSIESLSQMFQEWRNFIFGWLASKGRKTAKGSVRVWAGMCHANPCLVSASLCCWQPAAVVLFAWGYYHRPGKCKAKYRVYGEGWSVKGNMVVKQERMQMKGVQTLCDILNLIHSTVRCFKKIRCHFRAWIA